MKILFQGGWQAGRDPESTRAMITDYCCKLARFIVNENHTIVLTSITDCNKIVEDEIVRVAMELAKNPKDHLIYFLSQRQPKKRVENDSRMPDHGRIVRMPSTIISWTQERTEAVEYSDALIIVGGGRGTIDSMEKARLAEKPVFVAVRVECRAAMAWRANKKNIHILCLVPMNWSVWMMKVCYLTIFTAMYFH
jgi:hypothetical protein